MILSMTDNNFTLSHISLIEPDEGKLRRDTTARTMAFFCKRHPVRVDKAVIAELKQLAADGGKNVRVCLHDGPEAEHHDMVILEHRGKYYRPHKHLRKGEAFHIIEGYMGIFCFEDTGAVADACVLEPGDIYRVGVNMYHAVMPLTDQVIYHENKPGPFEGECDSIYPDWAPDGSDASAAGAYMQELKDQLPEIPS